MNRPGPTPVQGQSARVDDLALDLAIVTISMAMLMFEILQTITFSLQALGQQAFLVVSLCLLGLGAGGSLATWLDHERHGDRILWISGLSFAVAMVIATVGTSHSFMLPALIVWGVLPYLPVGIFLSALFRLRAERASRSYFLNLVGSALGCVALVTVLDGTGDAALTVLLIAALATVGALLLAVGISRRAMAMTAVFALLLVLLVPARDTLFAWSPAPQRAMAMIQQNPEIESEIVWSKWGYLGRLDVLEPGRGIEKFPIAGQNAAKLLRRGAGVRYLFANGGNWTEAVAFRGNEAVRREHAESANRSAPYYLVDRPDVLNIGVGAGVDIFTALYWNARSVTGIEINPLMIEAGREQLVGFHDDFYSDPRTRVLEMDGRTFVRNTESSFDVLTLTWVDTGAALHGNAQVLSENYLYTREAFDDYFRVLRDDGVLYIEHPFANTVRNLLTGVAALRAIGATEPTRHIALIEAGVLGVPGLVISKSPLGPERVAALHKAFPRRLAWAGGPSGGKGFFQDLLRAVGAGRLQAFLAEQPKDYRPVHDDRPFYYEYGRGVLESTAARLLLEIAAWVGAIAAILMLLPLRRIGVSARRPARLASVLGYFGAIGLGFMLVEICLIQKLTLFLEHPSYSVTVTLFAVLVFSGLGSLVSGHLPAPTPKTAALIFLPVLAFAAFYAFGLTTVVQAFEFDSLALRVVLVCALLAPGSFFMGMPFPTMVRMLADEDDILIEWGWAINSFASVAASVLAVFSAMQLGFSFTLGIGALCYLAAPLLFVAVLHTASHRSDPAAP